MYIKHGLVPQDPTPRLSTLAWLTPPRWSLLRVFPFDRHPPMANDLTQQTVSSYISSVHFALVKIRCSLHKLSIDQQRCGIYPSLQGQFTMHARGVRYRRSSQIELPALTPPMTQRLIKLAMHPRLSAADGHVSPTVHCPIQRHFSRRNFRTAQRSHSRVMRRTGEGTVRYWNECSCEHLVSGQATATLNLTLANECALKVECTVRSSTTVASMHLREPPLRAETGVCVHVYFYRWDWYQGCLALY